MSGLFSNVRLFVNKKQIVKKGHKKLNKLTKEQKKHLEVLGRQFKDKAATSKTATQDKGIEEVFVEIGKYDALVVDNKEKSLETKDKLSTLSKDYEADKKEYTKQLSSLEVKSKEIDDIVSSFLKEKKVIEGKIGKINKDIKSNTASKNKILKGLKSVKGDKDLSLAQAEAPGSTVQDIEQELYNLKANLEKEASEIKQLDDKIKPLKDDKDKLSKEIKALQKGFKDKSSEKTKRQEAINSDITVLEKEDFTTNAKLKLLYTDLGKLALEKPSRHKELSQTKAKLEDIDELKKKLEEKLTETTLLLQSPPLKKVKIYIILITTLSLLILLGVLFLITL